MLVGPAGRTVLAGKTNGGHDVGDDHDEHDDAENPNSGTVKHVMEEVGVGIKWLRSHEEHQVSDQVASEEKHQNKSGEGDNQLFPDGGGPVSFEATGKGVHGNFERWPRWPRDK